LLLLLLLLLLFSISSASSSSSSLSTNKKVSFCVQLRHVDVQHVLTLRGVHDNDNQDRRQWMYLRQSEVHWHRLRHVQHPTVVRQHQKKAVQRLRQQWNIPTLLTYLLTYRVTLPAGRHASDAEELIAEMEFGAEIAYKSVYVAPLINYSASSANSWWEDSHVTWRYNCIASNQMVSPCRRSLRLILVYYRNSISTACKPMLWSGRPKYSIIAHFVYSLKPDKTTAWILLESHRSAKKDINYCIILQTRPQVKVRP